MLWVVQALVGWYVFSGEESIVVGREEVGNMGCCRIGFAGVGVRAAERAGWLDYLTSSFCFVLS